MSDDGADDGAGRAAELRAGAAAPDAATDSDGGSWHDASEASADGDSDGDWQDADEAAEDEDGDADGDAAGASAMYGADADADDAAGEQAKTGSALRSAKVSGGCGCWELHASTLPDLLPPSPSPTRDPQCAGDLRRADARGACRASRNTKPLQVQPLPPAGWF